MTREAPSDKSFIYAADQKVEAANVSTIKKVNKSDISFAFANSIQCSDLHLQPLLAGRKGVWLEEEDEQLRPKVDVVLQAGGVRRCLLQPSDPRRIEWNI